MLEKFNQTAIIIIEITNEGKAPETRYVTIGVIGENSDKNELGKEALNYINTNGKKEVKEVIIADGDKYKEFIETNLANFANK